MVVMKPLQAIKKKNLIQAKEPSVCKVLCSNVDNYELRSNPEIFAQKLDYAPPVIKH